VGFTQDKQSDGCADHHNIKVDDKENNIPFLDDLCMADWQESWLFIIFRRFRIMKSHWFELASIRINILMIVGELNKAKDEGTQVTDQEEKRRQEHVKFAQPNESHSEVERNKEVSEFQGE